jgi:hypothetical protein
MGIDAVHTGTPPWDVAETCTPWSAIHASVMFVVSEADAAAIRTAFQERGEFAAAVELRRLFPGIRNTEQARECARTIAG